MTVPNNNFFDLQSTHKASTYRAFSNLLQMPNNHRMDNIKFFGNLSCSFKRIGFDDGSQLVIINFQLASHCTPHLQGSPFLCKTS